LSRSIPARVGIVAGSAVLIVVGAVAAMGASPAPSSSAADPGVSTPPQTPLNGSGPAGGPLGKLGPGFRGGDFAHGGFRDITIGAINGSSLSLKTDDGWTRTIAVGSATTITKGGQTIAVGDLKVGDQVAFRESRATDGSYSITAIQVILPVVGGQVTAVSGDTITVNGRGGATGTIHVSSTTTYDVNGTSGAKLSDITVGSFAVAEGTLRSDGSLDATVVRGGAAKGRVGGSGGPGFRFGPDDQGNPRATPNETPTAPTSAG
jgi:hypothetical protein